MPDPTGTLSYDPQTCELSLTFINFPANSGDFVAFAKTGSFEPSAGIQILVSDMDPVSGSGSYKLTSDEFATLMNADGSLGVYSATYNYASGSLSEVALDDVSIPNFVAIQSVELASVGATKSAKASVSEASLVTLIVNPAPIQGSQLTVQLFDNTASPAVAPIVINVDAGDVVEGVNQLQFTGIIGHNYEVNVYCSQNPSIAGLNTSTSAVNIVTASTSADLCLDTLPLSGPVVVGSSSSTSATLTIDVPSEEDIGYSLTDATWLHIKRNLHTSPAVKEITTSPFLLDDLLNVTITASFNISGTNVFDLTSNATSLTETTTTSDVELTTTLQVGATFVASGTTYTVKSTSGTSGAYVISCDAPLPSGFTASSIVFTNPLDVGTFSITQTGLTNGTTYTYYSFYQNNNGVGPMPTSTINVNTLPNGIEGTLVSNESTLTPGTYILSLEDLTTLDLPATPENSTYYAVANLYLISSLIPVVGCANVPVTITNVGGFYVISDLVFTPTTPIQSGTFYADIVTTNTAGSTTFITNQVAVGSNFPAVTSGKFNPVYSITTGSEGNLSSVNFLFSSPSASGVDGTNLENYTLNILSYNDTLVEDGEEYDKLTRFIPASQMPPATALTVGRPSTTTFTYTNASNYAFFPGATFRLGGTSCNVIDSDFSLAQTASTINTIKFSPAVATSGNTSVTDFANPLTYACALSSVTGSGPYTATVASSTQLANISIGDSFARDSTTLYEVTNISGSTITLTNVSSGITAPANTTYIFSQQVTHAVEASITIPANAGSSVVSYTLDSSVLPSLPTLPLNLCFEVVANYSSTGSSTLTPSDSWVFYTDTEFVTNCLNVQGDLSDVSGISVRQLVASSGYEIWADWVADSTFKAVPQTIVPLINPLYYLVENFPAINAGTQPISSNVMYSGYLTNSDIASSTLLNSGDNAMYITPILYNPLFSSAATPVPNSAAYNTAYNVPPEEPFEFTLEAAGSLPTTLQSTGTPIINTQSVTSGATSYTQIPSVLVPAPSSIPTGFTLSELQLFMFNNNEDINLNEFNVAVTVASVVNSTKFTTNAIGTLAVGNVAVINGVVAKVASFVGPTAGVYNVTLSPAVSLVAGNVINFGTPSAYLTNVTPALSNTTPINYTFTDLATLPIVNFGLYTSYVVAQYTDALGNMYYTQSPLSSAVSITGELGATPVAVSAGGATISFQVIRTSYTGTNNTLPGIQVILVGVDGSVTSLTGSFLAATSPYDVLSVTKTFSTTSGSAIAYAVIILQTFTSASATTAVQTYVQLWTPTA